MVTEKMSAKTEVKVVLQNKCDEAEKIARLITFYFTPFGCGIYRLPAGTRARALMLSDSFMLYSVS